MYKNLRMNESWHQKIVCEGYASTGTQEERVLLLDTQPVLDSHTPQELRRNLPLLDPFFPPAFVSAVGGGDVACCGCGGGWREGEVEGEVLYSSYQVPGIPGSTYVYTTAAKQRQQRPAAAYHVDVYTLGVGSHLDSMDTDIITSQNNTQHSTFVPRRLEI